MRNPNGTRNSLPAAFRMPRWKRTSASMRLSRVVAVPISRHASDIAAICSALRWAAARAAASGSKMRRISCTDLRKRARSGVAMYQERTSRSSRFQRSRGSTRVPTFGREFSSPFAFSILMASRTADRLMRSRLHHSASFGSRTPGAKSPRRMREPISSAALEWRLLPVRFFLPMGTPLSPSVLSLAQSPHAVKHDGDEDAAADEGALPERADAKQRQAVADHLDERGADDAADRRAAAAHEIGAAD